jgi:hypothetical protein
VLAEFQEFGGKPQGVASAGQPEAHEEKLGLVERYLREKIGTGGGLADDLEAPLRFQDRPQAEQVNGFAIGEHNTRLLAGAPRCRIFGFSSALLHD